MLIKDLAERAGVSVKAVVTTNRGAAQPARAAGYREYDAGDVLVVREIRALLSLGLTAEETVPFVECLRAGNDRVDVCRRRSTAIGCGTPRGGPGRCGS